VVDLTANRERRYHGYIGGTHTKQRDSEAHMHRPPHSNPTEARTVPYSQAWFLV